MRRSARPLPVRRRRPAAVPRRRRVEPAAARSSPRAWSPPKRSDLARAGRRNDVVSRLRRAVLRLLELGGRIRRRRGVAPKESRSARGRASSKSPSNSALLAISSSHPNSLESRTVRWAGPSPSPSSCTSRSRRCRSRRACLHEHRAQLRRLLRDLFVRRGRQGGEDQFVLRWSSGRSGSRWPRTPRERRQRRPRLTSRRRQPTARRRRPRRPGAQTLPSVEFAASVFGEGGGGGVDRIEFLLHSRHGVVVGLTGAEVAGMAAAFAAAAAAAAFAFAAAAAVGAPAASRLRLRSAGRLLAPLLLPLRRRPRVNRKNDQGSTNAIRASRGTRPGPVLQGTSSALHLWNHANTRPLSPRRRPSRRTRYN